MRKTMRRRLEVEMLESMTLLSGLAATFPNPLVLAGSDHGSYKLNGTESISKGSGSVTSLGHVKASAIGSTADGHGAVTLTAKAGKVFLDFVVRPSGTGYAGSYTITGGTKSFAGETGSGNVVLMSSGSGAHGKYTLTYSGNTG